MEALSTCHWRTTRRKREEQARLDRQWQQQLQRLEYECTLAERRYELVDPANRLVAQTLGTVWNERLAELEGARAEDRRRQRHTAPVNSPEHLAVRSAGEIGWVLCAVRKPTGHQPSQHGQSHHLTLHPNCQIGGRATCRPSSPVSR
jgi:hypothetical protein